jgi:hypothetical protein
VEPAVDVPSSPKPEAKIKRRLTKCSRLPRLFSPDFSEREPRDVLRVLGLLAFPPSADTHYELFID